MTGDNYSKKGQAFLIIIMFVSVALTVAIATSFRSVTETQVTKTQEDSIKAVAAADAAAEFGLGLPQTASPRSFESLQALGLGEFEDIDLERSNVTVSTSAQTEYVSPPVSKDGQYTFYWSVYENNTFGAAFSPGELTVYFGSVSSNCNEMALEFTIVSGDINNPDLRRRIADPGDILGSNNSELSFTPNPVELRGTQFNCGTRLPVLPNTRLIFVRYLTTGTSETRLGFTSNSLPPQGKIVRSEAVSNTGVRKVIESVQTYPQIPAAFFTTRL